MTLTYSTCMAALFGTFVTQRYLARDAKISTLDKSQLTFSNSR